MATSKTALVDADVSPEIATMQSQIQTLSDLYNRVQTLRQIPTILRPPTSVRLPMPSPPLRQEFLELKEIGESIRSEQVQEALRTAQDSEKADKSDLNSNGRRENRKRRRPPSPESPQPYVASQPKTSSLFPVSEDEPSPLQIDGLADYIHEFNQSNGSKLHVWTRTRSPGKFGNPVVLRFTIPDVLTAFITLAYSHDHPILVVETVAAFGPRERKSPHSQSDYLAYQSLSQQIAKMVQSYPRVSVQSLMGLLCSYDGIFVDQCTGCHRVLSAEGHVPPVGRLWVDRRWDPRHVTCLQN